MYKDQVKQKESNQGSLKQKENVIIIILFLDDIKMISRIIIILFLDDIQRV